MVKRKRVYQPPETSDGYRVLVDRLWPRGLSRDELALDGWLKELGPSDELRQWFGHDPDRWATFVSRFRRELARGSRSDLLDDLARRARRRTVTLLFAARDEERNHAVVIEQAIQARMDPAARRGEARRAGTPEKVASPTRRRAAS